MPTKQIAWQTGSGNITLTYQGQGDGTISVQSDANDGNARSQIINIQTTKGGLVTKNVTISQAACPIPVGTVLNYSYTGSYQEVELPAGQYKLQCWGAQGGSNAAASSYNITAKAGGKGGYSEGIITLSQKTTVRIYVGGQGSSSAGGYNGGGSTTGTSQYNSSNTLGYSKMGGGGGATDIRLSGGALLSRMIVAGGGSGGAMCYKKETTSTTTWETVDYFDMSSAVYDDTDHIELHSSGGYYHYHANQSGSIYGCGIVGSGTGGYYYFGIEDGDVIKVTTSKSVSKIMVGTHISGQSWFIFEGSNYTSASNTSSVQWTCNKTSSSTGLLIRIVDSSEFHGTVTLSKQVTTSSTTTSNESQVGFVGGGTNGGGYSSTYQGKQNAAGSGGSFGQGANQSTTNYRYCSGAGGGGWYGGGGGQSSDSSMTTCRYSGGGSGWVNTAASAGNRPSGYTGLQLDSGTTYRGDQSFPKASGSGNETGHSGNGYAKITRLA